MKGLVIFDAAMLALMLVLAVVLGVVCIMYGVYADESPRVAAELPLLLRSTAVFALLSIAWGTAFAGALRERAWLWPAQFVAVAGLIIGAMLLYARYT